VLSPALETVLALAHGEAVHRRHGHLTLEHLLFAAAHHPAGEEILRACAVDLDRLRADLERFLEGSVEQVRGGDAGEPVQTLAFRRVLQAALLHVRSAQREEAGVGDALAALLQQPKSHAAQALAAQGVSRLDVLNWVSHGVSKVHGAAPAPGGSAPAPAHAAGDEAPGAAGDPLAAYTVNLTERARAGELDPLVGRQAEIQRALEVLCRRRKNNPVFVGDAGVGKTALV
jgi:ATP-dependent Clp protease ATP-binding subunit ClpA